jgi:hypothetical protein
MTSSQEPPLTRRELRERERLLEQQQAASSTPDAAASPNAAAETPVKPDVTPPAPMPAVPAPPRAAPQQTPPPPAYAAPRPAGARDEASPFGGAIAGPAPANPFAPPSSSLPATPAPARYPDAVEPEPPTPERTLTRRELRAMLDANSDESFDLDLDDDRAEPTARPVPSVEAKPPAPIPAPIRAPAPHQVTESALADEPVAAPKPVGHWTDQLNAPVDRAEPFDQLLSRGAVSHGVPTTTNALILPNLPHHGTMGDSITPTGEVIVTGSIDLPRSYGASGVHPSQIDSSDVDRLFDQVEDGAGVGAPIAATRAVSTQGAARAMMAPPKKEGMNVPLVLAVTAGVLALGVVATLVIGAVAGLF